MQTINISDLIPVAITGRELLNMDESIFDSDSKEGSWAIKQSEFHKNNLIYTIAGIFQKEKVVYLGDITIGNKIELPVYLPYDESGALDENERMVSKLIDNLEQYYQFSLKPN